MHPEPNVRLLTAAAVLWLLSVAVLPATPRDQAAGDGTTDTEVAADPSRPLSEAEQKLQGTWQGYDFNQGFENWAFWIDGRDFRAEGRGDEWYAGRIGIDTTHDPAWIDFMIEDCNCPYKGTVSSGIFEWDGDSLVIAAPDPANPRPQRFVESSGDMMRLQPAKGIDLVLAKPQ